MDRNRLEKLLVFLENDPQDSFILFALAQEYTKLGELSTALSTYQDLQKYHPQYVGLYYHLGKLWEELDEHENALEAYTQGIKIAQDLQDLHALSELKTAKTNLELEL